MTNKPPSCQIYICVSALLINLVEILSSAAGPPNKRAVDSIRVFSVLKQNLLLPMLCLQIK